MQYSTDNFTLSVFTALATKLRSEGYDIRWAASGDVEAHTSALPSALAEITLTNSFPANPTSVVRLNGGTLGEGEVAIPCFTVVTGQPKRVRRDGIGSPVFERERSITIVGFAEDERQQVSIADIMVEWLGDLYLGVFDYSVDPVNPTALDDAFVQYVDTTVEELDTEADAVRYYTRADFGVRYYE